VADKKNRQKAAVHKISAFEPIPKDLLAIRYNIFSGYPIMISLNVDSPFVSDGYEHAKSGSPFIWHYNPAKKYGHGRHAVVCTGYDDKTGMFKILNSWGIDWGQQGYFFMSYEDFVRNVYELYIAYGLDPSAISPASLAPLPGAPPVNGFNGEFSSWFKVGYYRKYNNINVGLTYLDRHDESIIVSFTESLAGNLIQSLYLRKGETKKFVYKNHTVSFTFDQIGRAGRNPLTPAAFFSIFFQPVISIHDTTILIQDIERLCAVKSGGDDRNFGSDPFIQFNIKLEAGKNSVWAQIMANITEPGGDRTSGNVQRYEKIIDLPENYTIETILTPIEANISAQLTHKGLNPFAFIEETSPISLVTLVGDSDGNNNDDLFPGPCVDDIHAQIRRIQFYPIKLRYQVVGK